MDYKDPRVNKFKVWILKEDLEKLIKNPDYYYKKASKEKLMKLNLALENKHFKIILKRCNQCGEYLDMDCFSHIKSRNFTDNKLNTCKSCRNTKALNKRNSDKNLKIKNQIDNINKSCGYKITPNQWLDCLKFFGYKDAYDGKDCELRDLTIDHIVPHSLCGKNVPWNIVPTTRENNSSKGNKPLDIWLLHHSGCDLNMYFKIKEWQVYAYKKYKDDYNSAL